MDLLGRYSNLAACNELLIYAQWEELAARPLWLSGGLAIHAFYIIVYNELLIYAQWEELAARPLWLYGGLAIHTFYTIHCFNH